MCLAQNKLRQFGQQSTRLVDSNFSTLTLPKNAFARQWLAESNWLIGHFSTVQCNTLSSVGLRKVSVGAETGQLIMVGYLMPGDLVVV